MAKQLKLTAFLQNENSNIINLCDEDNNNALKSQNNLLKKNDEKPEKRIANINTSLKLKSNFNLEECSSKSCSEDSDYNNRSSSCSHKKTSSKKKIAKSSTTATKKTNFKNGIEKNDNTAKKKSHFFEVECVDIDNQQKNSKYDIKKEERSSSLNNAKKNTLTKTVEQIYQKKTQLEHILLRYLIIVEIR